MRKSSWRGVRLYSKKHWKIQRWPWPEEPDNPKHDWWIHFRKGTTGKNGPVGW